MSSSLDRTSSHDPRSPEEIAASHLGRRRRQSASQ